MRERERERGGREIESERVRESCSVRGEKREVRLRQRDCERERKRDT